MLFCYDILLQYMLRRCVNFLTNLVCYMHHCPVSLLPRKNSFATVCLIYLLSFVGFVSHTNVNFCSFLTFCHSSRYSAFKDHAAFGSYCGCHSHWGGAI